MGSSLCPLSSSSCTAEALPNTIISSSQSLSQVLPSSSSLNPILPTPPLTSQAPPPPTQINSHHSMVTRSRNNIKKPVQKLTLNTIKSATSTIEPSNTSQAFKDPN